MPRAGDLMGPYTLINKIGHGGFGEVWLAERRTAITTTTAALKIPHNEDVDLETIKHEANLWVRASGHPNVLPIIEADIYGDRVVIASEYASDGSLESWLRSFNGNPPPLETGVDVIMGILAGLEHLHARNIIHRDLKPANILFQGGTPRITDFGISRVLKTTSNSTTKAGTPAYMAPEAFSGKRNQTTDIWSVGAISFYMLAGRMPFPQTDFIELIGAICAREPEPLPASTPKSLVSIVSRALAKDPNQRFQSASEMRTAFKVALRTAVQYAEEKLTPVASRARGDRRADSEETILDAPGWNQKTQTPFDPENPAGLSEEEKRLHNNARRFARLLVSEIKLYNEYKVKEGREHGDVYSRLKEEIDSSRKMYEKRVASEVKARFDYFYYELVKQICEGDASKLGTDQAF